MSKQFYITTAIDYVNGNPHLGHAYEKVISDVIARARRSMGEDAFFLTGNDEHGQKVQQAAEEKGMDAQSYCDALAAVWRPFVDRLQCSINDYIRTTEDRHKVVVQAILDKLNREGQFYRKTHAGFYSVKEETFLTERDRLPDGTFDPSLGKIIELEEENYYFRLGEHQEWLIGYIQDHPDFIAPEYRRNEVLGFLKNNVLEDLCITRPSNRLKWGIPLPFDDQFVTYVWFDALVNYITVPASLGDTAVRNAIGLPPLDSGLTTELWPADTHVIGKDILKFHAVYWPIMLKAIGLPMPKQILVHGWWQKEGAKISKATGNIVDPIAVIDEWGLDAFRYYVVRELAIGPDGNWTDGGFEARYSAELANGLGNLVNRSLSMLRRYREQLVPQQNDELKDTANQTIATTRQQLSGSRLQEGLKTIWEFINRLNQYIDQTAPFRLAKNPSQSDRLDEVLYNLVEGCRILAVLTGPYLPETSAKIMNQLNLPADAETLAGLAWGGISAGHKTGDPVPLFPRKDSKASEK